MFLKHIIFQASIISLQINSLFWQIQFINLILINNKTLFFSNQIFLYDDYFFFFKKVILISISFFNNSDNAFCLHSTMIHFCSFLISEHKHKYFFWFSSWQRKSIGSFSNSNNIWIIDSRFSWYFQDTNHSYKFSPLF